jgi:hypothetical protein
MAEMKVGELGAARRRLERGSADHRFCGPRLFGLVMGQSNSCTRIRGHSDPVDDTHLMTCEIVAG